MANMFKSHDKLFYHDKPDYFNVFYLVNLSYHCTDLIWLLFIYEMQTDFITMFLHHICTISLIVFSYMTNYSNIGCIVMFLHDFGDIFVYLVRIVINTNAKSIFKIVGAQTLLIVFAYTRIYVFGDLLRIMLNDFWFWDVFNITLTSFLGFLYVMHIYWVYAILKKLYKAMTADKFEDTYRIKKK